MRKEFVGNVLGANFGIVRKVHLDNGNIIKVKNDDWGYFVYVVDPNGEILYTSELLVYISDVDVEVEHVKYRYC